MTHLSILSKDIRILDGLYSLNDLHKASGNKAKHAPFRFMRNEQTVELIAEIERSPDLVIGCKVLRGGKLQGTWVCKELVYAYAMWISAGFTCKSSARSTQSQANRKLHRPASRSPPNKPDSYNVPFRSLTNSKRATGKATASIKPCSSKST